MVIFNTLVSLIFFGFVYTSVLLGSLTSESAILFTAVIAPFAFLTGSLKGAMNDPNGFTSDFWKSAFAVGTACFLFLILIFFNGLRFESCSVDQGFYPFLVLSLPVLFLNIVLGTWFGRMIKNVRLVSILFLPVVLTYIFIQTLWWWQMPSLRFFNHNFILIAGDLLQGQGITPEIIAYRTSTFLFAVSGLLLGNLFFRNKNRGRSLFTSFHNTGIFWVIVAVFCLANFIHFKSSKAISPSRSKMEQQYSSSKQQGILFIHFDPSQISSVQTDAILAEGKLWLSRLEKRSGISPNAPIHIWLHSNIQTQERFTGAKNVHFTLPKHREIHISTPQIPHPTLGHELAHVLLGQQSSTVWGVLGRYGILPNAGLSEGLAVLLTPELISRDNLDLMEQAAAIYQDGLLNNVLPLFSLVPWKFHNYQSGKAYVMSGAFLKFMIQSAEQDQTKDQNLIRKLAKAGTLNIDSFQKKSLEAYAKDFNEHLISVKLPLYAKNSVNLFFGKQAFANLTCSKKALKTEKKLQSLILQDSPDEAFDLVSQMPEEMQTAASFRTAKLAWKFDKLTVAQSFLERTLLNLSNTENNEFVKAQENYGDLLWQMSKRLLSLKAYQQIDLNLLNPDSRRRVIIKKEFAKAAVQNIKATQVADTMISLLSQKEHYENEIRAYFNSLGVSLTEHRLFYNLPTKALALGNYLNARTQILGGNYLTGISQFKIFQHQEKRLPDIIQTETEILKAYAYANKDMPNKAIPIYQRLKDEAQTSGSRMLFDDYLERAKLAASALEKHSSLENENNKLLTHFSL